MECGARTAVIERRPKAARRRASGCRNHRRMAIRQRRIRRRPSARAAIAGQLLMRSRICQPSDAWRNSPTDRSVRLSAFPSDTARCDDVTTTSARNFTFPSGQANSVFTLIRRAATQQMPIAVLRHPFRPRQMAIKSTPSAFRFAIRVDMQNDPSDLTPVCTFGISIEQPQVSHQMLLVITRQSRVCRCDINHVGIERRFMHRPPA